MIRHEIREGTAFLTIENPPANTWTPQSLLDLEKLVAELSSNPAVRALVVTGSGGKFFSAGADLKTFNDTPAAAREFIARFGTGFGALRETRLVVIAAINGYAMGGGLECALSCDIRIAEEHAQMALPEPAVGLLPGGCGTQMLPWLVGEGWAKRMILTNERVDAQTALRIGLVQEVVARGQSVEAAAALAARVATLSPQAVEICKKLIHNARNGVAKPAGLADERERFMDLFTHPDRQEGVGAFLEKRAPQWRKG